MTTEPSPVSVRRFAPADQSGVVALWSEVFADDLAVLPAERRRGIATRLVRAVEAALVDGPVPELPGAALRR